MSSYSKGTWFLLGFVMVAMLSLIDVIEVRIPAGALSTDLMLGITMLGFVSIFVWLHRHCAQTKPQKQISGFRLVGRVGEMTVYKAYSVEESVAGPQETHTDVVIKPRILRRQTVAMHR